MTLPSYSPLQLTRDDQQLSNNLQRWTMSRRPACGSLQSSYEGDIRLVMEPALLADQEKSVYGSQLVEPTCNLPLNFTGLFNATVVVSVIMLLY